MAVVSAARLTCRPVDSDDGSRRWSPESPRGRRSGRHWARPLLCSRTRRSTNAYPVRRTRRARMLRARTLTRDRGRGASARGQGGQPYGRRPRPGPSVDTRAPVPRQRPGWRDTEITVGEARRKIGNVTHEVDVVLAPRESPRHRVPRRANGSRLRGAVDLRSGDQPGSGSSSRRRRTRRSSTPTLPTPTSGSRR